MFLASLPLIALASFSSPFHHYGSIDFGETLVILLQTGGSHLNCFLCGINKQHATNVVFDTSVRVLDWIHKTP